MSVADRYKSWSPAFLSLLRAVSGFLMAAHGAQKLFGALGGQKAELMSQAGLAGVIEFFGGVLLILGLFTRPVAFILSGTMAVAYFQVHAPGGFWPIVNKGELAVLYCFVFLYLSAAGGGPISLDALISGGRRR
jgi:putative oxidoreductase